MSNNNENQIWGLNLPTARKFALTGIFAVGIMSLAAAVTRLVIHILVLDQGYGAGYDINRTSFFPLAIHSLSILSLITETVCYSTEAVTTLFYWSMMESGLGTIVANLPTLSFLMRDSGWFVKLLRKGSSWTNLLQFTSWRSSRTKISGEEASGNGTGVVHAKWSNPDSLDSGNFHTVPMEYLKTHPTIESNRSQKELLTNMRPNDSPA